MRTPSARSPAERRALRLAALVVPCAFATAPALHGDDLDALLAFSLALIVLWPLLMALALALACRLVGGAAPSFGRALGVALLQIVAWTTAGSALAILMGRASLGFAGLHVLVMLAACALPIRATLPLGFGRTLAVAGIEMALAAVGLGSLLLLFLGFLKTLG